jgi:hypothetical protein
MDRWNAGELSKTTLRSFFQRRPLAVIPSRSDHLPCLHQT